MRAGLLTAMALGLVTPAWAQSPDVIASAVVAPATADVRGTVNLAATFRNAGDAMVGGELKYTWFISSDRAVTLSDTVIATRIAAGDLGPAQSVTVTDTVTLPAGLLVGAHFIGVCANHDSSQGPRFVVSEVTYTNNCAQAVGATVLSTATLTVKTPSALPPAALYSPYGLHLEAEGGNGSHQWQLLPGAALPLGLRLENGNLVGSPSVLGSFGFGMRVTSGAATAEATFQLEVGPGTVPLTLVDQDLSSAEFGRPYDSALLAVGGKPPYRWSSKGPMPASLLVTGDGRVIGRPSAVGEFTFGVRVADQAMASAEQTVRIRVTKPAGLHIAIAGLATANLGRDYSQALTAVGGKAPYVWEVLSSQRMPQDVTEGPEPDRPGLPEGFGLAIESGALKGVPKRAGLYALSLKVTDANSAEDSTRLLLEVSYLEPIAIVTLAVPDAFVGSDYLVKLAHNRMVESPRATFSLPCVLVRASDGSFSCPPSGLKQQPPAGIVLREDGTLIGNSEAEPGVYNFLVGVTDEFGRRDVRGLSVSLRPRLPEERTGCSSAGLGPLAVFSLLVLVFIRRRKVAS